MEPRGPLRPARTAAVCCVSIVGWGDDGWSVTTRKLHNNQHWQRQLAHGKVIGCSSLRGGGGELGTNKNLDLWLQLVCTKLKLKHTI